MSACRQYLKRQYPRRLASRSIIALGLMSWSSSAFAYRPFDGTDAAIAATGEVEIELQPGGRLREQRSTTLIAPATVLNYGRGMGGGARRPGSNTADTTRSHQPHVRGSIPKTCLAARQPARQDRAQRRDGIWRAASRQHREFRRRSKSGWDRLAALGLGNDPFER